uniref:Uncharacterized protein n=1 Tax=Rhizophora mucronata TaxID=61149 RepID=A0A2P2NPI1_RHIMU
MARFLYYKLEVTSWNHRNSLCKNRRRRLCTNGSSLDLTVLRALCIGNIVY